MGETKRTLNIRAEEHITAIKSASKKSHTAEHCWKYNHDFDWKHKKVLDFEKNWKTRTIKESIYSEENEHHINGISFKLPNIWKPILRENKAKKTTAKTKHHQTESAKVRNRVWFRTGPNSKSTNQERPQNISILCKHIIPDTHSHTVPDDGRSISRNVAEKHYDSRHDQLRNNMNTTELTNTKIFKIIKEQYGASTLSQCRKLEKTELKYARYTNHLRYSLRCLHNNLIPNDLYLKPKLQDPKSRKILDKASRLLLQNRIHENHNIRKDLQSSIKQTTDNLSDTLTQEHFTQMQDIHSKTYKHELGKSKERQLKKFNTLYQKRKDNQQKEINEQTTTVDKSKWVINLSTYNITKDERELLENGMNFSVTPPALPTIDLIAKIETTLTGMITEEADTIRADLSSIIRKAKPPKRNITRKQSISLKPLQQNENIIILPADKGRATVVLDKEDYIKKCNEHLTSGPYTKLKKDPTSSVVSKVTKKLIELRDNNLIKQQEYFKLKPTGTQPPRFYGLPKIHKDGIPMRPIVSYTGTPLYEISKYIANILRPYGKLKEQHTHSSKSFSTFICQQKIEPDEIMVSFDVTSLYTTIPIDQALLIIRDLLEHDQKLADRTLLSPKQNLDLLDILLRTTYFKFNGDFYQQTDGAAMGGPTSAIVSEIYMQSLETTAITTADHPPKIWEHHVDDVFSIVHKAYLQELLEHINNLHPQTQFTKEEESNSSLPFLDTLVQRNHDKSISVKIYRKPTHTNQYLKYTSHNPTSAKQSVITALFDRADNVVSNEKDKIEEKHLISAALQQNGYPKEFIQRTVRKHIRRKEQSREHPEEKPEHTRSINLLTSKDSASSLNEHLINTTSKQHSTPRQLSEVYYQNQRKTGTMLYINWTVKIVKLSTWEKQNEH